MGAPQPPPSGGAFADKAEKFYALAKANGMPDAQIQAMVGQRAEMFREKARAMGMPEAQIDSEMGVGSHDAAALQPVRDEFAQNLGASPSPVQSIAQNPLDAFKAGLQSSSGGLIATQKLPDTILPEHAGIAQRLSYDVGQFGGDLPVSIAGMIGGAHAGAALGGLAGGGAGATVPVVGETGASEVVGGGAGALYGGIAGGGAGFMATPVAVKDVATRLIEQKQYHNAADLAQDVGSILWDTTKNGVVGAATALVGGPVAGRVLSGVSNPALKFAGKTGAELATMTSVSAALQGRLPTKEDVIDGAVLLSAFHVAGSAAARISPKVYDNAKTNLARHWAATEEPIPQAAVRAASEPVMRTQMSARPDPRINPASSSTPTGDAGAHFMVGRATGAFDDDVKFVMNVQEGGGRLTTDTGGLTKWGLSKNANPDLDIAHMSASQAMEIYHARYWKPIGADNIADPQLRRAAFDSAVNEGVPLTKEWLKQSGGDLQKFMDLRAQRYAQLIAQDPVKYGKYEKTWNQRLANLGSTKSLADIKLPEEGEGGERPPAEEEPPAPEEPPEGPDGAYERVKRTMGDFDEPAGPSLGQKIQEASLNIYRELMNPDHPISQLADAMQDGGTLTDLNNPNFARRLLDGSKDTFKQFVEKDYGPIDASGKRVGPALEDILGDLKGDDLEKQLVYSRARWAQEMHERGMKPGIDKADADAVVAKGTPAQGKVFQQLVDFRNSTLAYYHDVGQGMSDEGYQAALDQHKASIPGYRLFEDEAKQGSGAYGTRTRQVVKQMKGSERRTAPILQGLIREAALRVEMANRMKSDRDIADAAASVDMARKAKAPVTPITLTENEIAKLAGEHGGLEEDDGGTATIFRRIAKGVRDDQVPIFRDGKVEAWEFDDPAMVRALRNYDKPTITTIGKIVRAATSIPRAMITRVPTFPLKLAQYDLLWQPIANPDFKNSLANFYRGIGEQITKGPGYDEWLRSGFADHAMPGSANTERYIADILKGHEDPSFGDGAWNAVRWGGHQLQAWGQLLSNAQRVGRFARGQEAGESTARSGVAAQQVAFHRAGYGGPVLKALNQGVMFSAAHVNGLEQVIRSMFGIGKSVTGAKYDPKQFWGMGTALITLPVLANWWASKDQEWYKGAPDWQKNNGLMFHMGPDWERTTETIDGRQMEVMKPQGHTFYWKMPPLVSLMFGGLPRMLASTYFEHNPDAFKDFGHDLGESLIPGAGFMNLSVLQPMFEHIANYSFMTGHPLVSDDERKQVGTTEQYTPYSTDFAKATSRFVGGAMGLSPVVIDNYINEWSGGFGEQALHVSQAVLNQAGGHEAALSPESWPGLHSWMTRYPGASDQQVLDFEGRMDKFTQVHGSLERAMEAGDAKRVQELAQANPTAAAMHAFRLGQKELPGGAEQYLQIIRQASAGADLKTARDAEMLGKVLSRQRQMARNINDNPKMTPNDKRQQIDTLYTTMQAESEHVLAEMDQAGLK